MFCNDAGAGFAARARRKLGGINDEAKAAAVMQAVSPNNLRRVSLMESINLVSFLS